MKLLKHTFDNYEIDGTFAISCEVIYDISEDEVAVCHSTQTVLSGTIPIYSSDFYPNSTIVDSERPGEAFGFSIPSGLLSDGGSVDHSYHFFTQLSSHDVNINIPEKISEISVADIKDSTGELFAKIICQRSEKKAVTLKILFRNLSSEKIAYIISPIIDGDRAVQSHVIMHSEYHGWTEGFNIKAKSSIELNIKNLKAGEWKTVRFNF